MSKHNNNNFVCAMPATYCCDSKNTIEYGTRKISDGGGKPDFKIIFSILKFPF